MSLYGNILLVSTDGEEQKSQPSHDDVKPKVNSCASMKLLQDHLLSKKRLKQSSHQSQKVQKVSQASNASFKHSQFEWDIYDDYDPMIPNSFEILQLECIKAEELRQNSMKNVVGKIDPNILDVLDRLDEEENVSDTRNIRGTAIAPPTTLKSNKYESLNSSNISISKVSKPVSEKLDGSSAAAKIMAKMGYKVGQGLGKDEQGISTPLEVEKDGLIVSRIVVHQPKILTTQEIDSKHEESPVLLLQNMVRPGEVDDDLEVETKMECTKYGEVVKCLIYEIPNKLVPDELAVRIFVEFKEIESAKRAANDLDGRYFGGRVVKASFYDVNKFNKYELGL